MEKTRNKRSNKFAKYIKYMGKRWCLADIDKIVSILTKIAKIATSLYELWRLKHQ